MQRETQISIARLMGVVLVAGIGCAALRSSSEDWAGAMLLVTGGVLLIAAAGAFCRGREERAWWLGFALFGGGYLALVHGTAGSDNPLPTITLVEALTQDLGAKPAASVRNPVFGNPVLEGWNSLSPRHRILHCLWSLALAGLGWLLAGVLIAGPDVRTPVSEERAPSEPWSPPCRGKRPIFIGLAAFWIAAIVAVAGRLPAPGLWAGVSFLLTCGLLGMAVLGAGFRRGRDREPWLGAALFGFGYLALTFGKSALFIVAPHLPTEVMINSFLRPGGPPVQSEFPDFTTAGFARVRGQVITRKLDEPIPFHFPQETPLDEVLKYIREATREPNFPGIPIYVDPVGLQNAERSLSSKVQLDIEAIPLRDALRLLLKQLGLGFVARDGFIMISDEGSATIPVYEDPVQVVGHSLLALLAAALGALAVPLVSDRSWRRRRRSS